MKLLRDFSKITWIGPKKLFRRTVFVLLFIGALTGLAFLSKLSGSFLFQTIAGIWG